MRCTAPTGGAREKERCVCKVSEHKPKVLEKCVEWKKQNKTEQCIMGVYFQNKSPDTEKKKKIKRLQVKKQKGCFWLTQTHGCLRAWSAVIRLAGLIVNIWLIRFLASGVTVSHSGEGNWRRRKKKNVTFCIYYIEFNGKKNDLKRKKRVEPNRHQTCYYKTNKKKKWICVFTFFIFSQLCKKNIETRKCKVKVWMMKRWDSGRADYYPGSSQSFHINPSYYAHSLDAVACNYGN